MSNNNEADSAADGEKCDRCGRVGLDRRTLWHACFYQMNEMRYGYFKRPLPFKERYLFQLLGDARVSKEPVSIGPKDGIDRQINIIPGRIRTDDELEPHGFYTLRVCKECRADWMDAIEQWFDMGNRWGERISGGSDGG